MKKRLSVSIFFRRDNRYSINALLGAIEGLPFFDEIDFTLIDNEAKLLESLKNHVRLYQKSLLLVSFFTSQLFETMELVRKIRSELGKDLVLVAGGPHPTGAPHGTLKMGFDIVVKGEGEETIQELLAAFLNNEDWTAVKGIVYACNGEAVHSGSRPPVDLNRFKPFSQVFRRFGPIEITRGCPFGCYYCQTPRIFKGPVRHRSIDAILGSVKNMCSNNLRDIRFITPNALSYGSEDGVNINLEAVETLLKEIRQQLGSNGRIFFGSFPSEVRPEHVTGDALELLKRYVDNKNLVIGAQSGSQKILDLCRRGHTVEDIYRAVSLSTKAGFLANVDFIFGLPGETDDDILETERVIVDLVRMGARIHAHTFVPLPQTPFSKAPPGRVSPKLKEVINRLLPKGVIFGDWQKQEVLAKRVSEYLRTVTTGVTGV